MLKFQTLDGVTFLSQDNELLKNQNKESLTFYFVHSLIFLNAKIIVMR